LVAGWIAFSYRMANALWAYERYISKPFGRRISQFFTRIRIIGRPLWRWARHYCWPCGRDYSFGAPGKIRIACRLVLVFGNAHPTIGLVQVGSQSMADRYMYIPSIGLFILVVWGVADFLNWRPHWQRIMTMAGGVALAGCLVGTRIQLSYWQNSIELFRHAIEVTTDNFVAYTCLGETLRDLG